MQNTVTYYSWNIQTEILSFTKLVVEAIIVTFAISSNDTVYVFFRVESHPRGNSESHSFELVLEHFLNGARRVSYFGLPYSVVNNAKFLSVFVDFGGFGLVADLLVPIVVESSLTVGSGSVIELEMVDTSREVPVSETLTGENGVHIRSLVLGVVEVDLLGGSSSFESGVGKGFLLFYGVALVNEDPNGLTPVAGNGLYYVGVVAAHVVGGEGEVVVLHEAR